jgi:glucosamine--fructose-6-phosphate aminotransferase (isomerizing)
MAAQIFGDAFNIQMAARQHERLAAFDGPRKMDLRQQILDTPKALRATLENGRPEFELVIRRVRWDEGPVVIVGTGSSFPVALTGAHAFETMLGWEALARTPIDFMADTLPLLRPRSVVLAVSNSGESFETLEAANAARARGAVVLALTSVATSALAKMADLVFQLRSGPVDESARTGPVNLGAVLCQQAAMGYICLVAARTLKRHRRQFDVLEEEFAELPALVEWNQAQMRDAVRALASQVKASPNLLLVGAGFYFPAALQVAVLLKQLSAELGKGLLPPQVTGIDAAGLGEGGLDPCHNDAAVTFLSGSHCRSRKKLHALARSMKRAGVKVFSVTDSNDRELSAASTLSLLVPALTEMLGSTLALAVFQSMAFQAAHRLGLRAERRLGAPPIELGRP